MKIVGKVIAIFTITLVTFLYVLMNSAFSIIKDGDYIKKEFKENNVYKEANDSIKEELREKFNDFKDYVPDVDELVDNTITQDIIESELNDLLDKFYNNEKIKVDFDEILGRYKASLEIYLKNNDIEINEEVKEKINKLMAEISVEHIEGNDVTDNPTVQIYAFRRAMDLASLTLLSIIAFVIVLTIIFSNNKLNAIYISSFISSGLLLQIYLSSKLFGSVIETDSKYKGISTVLEHFSNKFLSNVFEYIIMLLVVSIVLLEIDFIIKKQHNE